MYSRKTDKSYYALVDAYKNYIGYDVNRNTVFVTECLDRAYTTKNICALGALIDKYGLFGYNIKPVC